LGCLSRLSLLPELLIGTENQQLVAGRIYFEFFNDFMLMGLRDTAGNLQVRKWQRIYAQVRGNLKSYQARGVGNYVFRNWHRSGCRRKCLQLARQAVMIKLLSCCPVGWFHALAGCLPLGKDVRENYYDKRKEYVAYG
jgi:hypothetical protein